MSAKTMAQALGSKQKRLACLALAGACALSCGVIAAAAVNTSEAEALTYTGFLSQKQFDGKHVAYLGQKTETCAALIGSTPSNVKVTNKKVATIPYSGPSELYVDFKAKGSTKITYKVNGKTHTSSWTIKKFTNPFATFKTGSKNLKSYGSAANFNGTITGYDQAPIYTGIQKDIVYQDGTAQGDSIKGLQTGKKLVVKASKGWKIYSINSGGMKIKNGQVIPKGTGSVSVIMQNKQDKTLVHYVVSNTSDWG